MFDAFHAVPFPDIGAVGFSFRSEPQDILNNKWHHIAYTYYLGIHKFFVDGKVIHQQENWMPEIAGVSTEIAIGDLFGDFRGEALIDDVGVFGIGLSDETVRAMYSQLLSEFISALSIDPKGKVSTTWAAIKSN